MGGEERQESLRDQEDTAKPTFRNGEKDQKKKKNPCREMRPFKPNVSIFLSVYHRHSRATGTLDKSLNCTQGTPLQVQVNKPRPRGELQ